MNIKTMFEVEGVKQEWDEARIELTWYNQQPNRTLMGVKLREAKCGRTYNEYRMSLRRQQKALKARKMNI